MDKDAISAPFPDAQNASKFNLPDSIKKLDSEIIVDCKYLAFYPSSVETSCTISQVVGDGTVAAWDLVPLSIAEVAAATKECKTFGKLYRAIKLGIIDTKDKESNNFILKLLILKVQPKAIDLCGFGRHWQSLWSGTHSCTDRCPFK